MKRTLLLLVASLVIACTSGCGKKPAADQANTSTPDTTAPASGDTATATAPEPPGPQPVPIPDNTPAGTATATADSSAPADLTQLTVELRRWMMNTRSGVPKTFEEWVARAKIHVPPPPAGKKYAIKSGWVVLVDK